MKRRKELFETLGFVLLLIVITIQSIYFGFRKEGYHLDEMYSYGLANSNYLPFMHMGDSGAYDVADFMHEYGTGNNPIEFFRNLGNGVVDFSKAHFRFSNMEMYDPYQSAQIVSNDTKTTTWLTGQYFQDYLSVQEGERFNIASVYYNQRGDVHPPFYYLLLNVVSSIFAGQFSKWFAFAVNYLVLMITLILLYRMVRNHLGNYCTAMTTVAIYGLGSGFLTTMVFFRMYATLTMWTVALCYFHLYLQKRDFVMTKRKRRALTALVFFGYYTQYFFVVYAGVMMLTVVGYLLRKKRAKEIWGYVRAYVSAAVIGVVVWPFSIKHIFFGYRGADVRSSLMSGNSLYKVKRMLNEIAENCFGGSRVLIYVLICAGIAAYIVNAIRGYRRTGRKPAVMRYLILFLPASIYFILISMSVTILVERYVMNIMPFVAVFVGLLFGYIGRQIPKVNMSKASFATATVLSLGFCAFTCGLVKAPEYLTIDKQEKINVPAETVCVYVMPDDYWTEFHKDAVVLSQCDSVAIVYESNLDFLKDYQYKQGQTVMVYLNPYIDQAKVLETVRENMGITHLKQTEVQVDESYYTRRVFQ